MKKALYILAIIAVFYGGFMYGVMTERDLGGVRTRTTGFYLNEGENIAIGTSTPVLADIHVYRTGTSTIAIDGTVMGCLRMLDTDGAGYTNIGVLNGAVTFPTDADCGF